MKHTSAHILKAGLIVGTLDIIAALVYFYISTGQPDISIVFKYIASALFGKQAFSGGNSMVLAGLLLHYLIAFAFTLFFFTIFQKSKILRRYPVPMGILYGAFIWVVMNFVVVPLSRIPARPFNLADFLVNLLILVVCIGIPLSIMAKRSSESPRLNAAG